MKTVHDKSFKTYGRVLNLDLKEFLQVLRARPVTVAGTVAYEPSLDSLEQLPLFRTLQEEVYGGLPMELGHCSGFNDRLNALEYHRSSEVDIAATDLVLMLGRQQDIDYANLTYDTAKVEMFLVPAGTAVELFATTLHFAPCGIGGREFRQGVALPRGTNLPLEQAPVRQGENACLFARNKWLLAHPDSGLDRNGAWLGLRGRNLKLEEQ